MILKIMFFLVASKKRLETNKFFFASASIGLWCNFFCSEVCFYDVWHQGESIYEIKYVFTWMSLVEAIESAQIRDH